MAKQEVNILIFNFTAEEFHLSECVTWTNSSYKWSSLINTSSRCLQFLSINNKIHRLEINTISRISVNQALIEILFQLMEFR